MDAVVPRPNAEPRFLRYEIRRDRLTGLVMMSERCKHLRTGALGPGQGLFSIFSKAVASGLVAQTGDCTLGATCAGIAMTRGRSKRERKLI